MVNVESLLVVGLQPPLDLSTTFRASRSNNTIMILVVTYLISIVSSLLDLLEMTSESEKALRTVGLRIYSGLVIRYSRSDCRLN